MRITILTSRIIFFGLLILVFACSSQKEMAVSETLSSRMTDEKIWDSTEVNSPPEIKGGPMALAKATNYPEISRRNKESGTVQVEFVVWSDGSISDLDVVESVSERLDQEAIAAIEKIKFNPAVRDGKRVNSRFSLPVRFRLRR